MSGQCDALETRAARSTVMNDLPAPGRPTSSEIRPSGMRPGQSQGTACGSTSAIHTRSGSRRMRTSCPTDVGCHGVTARASVSISARMPSNSATSPWPSIQSTMSPRSGRPSSATLRTTGAGVNLTRIPATVSAYFRPGSSLSGRIQTSLPASGFQSVLLAACDPPAEVVATNPSVSAVSAHLSPSTTTTTFAATRSGRP